MSKKRRTKFEVRRMESNENDFGDVYKLMLDLHRQGSYAKLDEDKAAANIYTMLTHNFVWGAYYKDECVGTLGLLELPYWYSRETFLQDSWIYVDPEYRYENLGVLLLKEARDVGLMLDKDVYLTIIDPNRRSQTGKMAKWAVLAGFKPVGHTSII